MGRSVPVTGLALLCLAAQLVLASAARPLLASHSTVEEPSARRVLMDAEVSVSSTAAASEDHLRRNGTPWQAVQQQFKRWTGVESPSISGRSASLGQRQPLGDQQSRFSTWRQQALHLGTAISAGEFLEGETLERGTAEGQLPAKALVAMTQEPYDAQQYAAQRAAAWERAITD